MLARFGYEEIKVTHGEEEYQSAGRLVVPKFPDGARGDEQGPSSSRKNPGRNDGQGGSRRLEEPMQQEPDQAEKEDDKASTGGISSVDFNFLSNFENGTDMLETTTEPAAEGTSTLEPPSAFMGTNRNSAESGSPSNSKSTEQKLLMEYTKEKKNRRRCQSTFLGNVARRRVAGAS